MICAYCFCFQPRNNDDWVVNTCFSWCIFLMEQQHYRMNWKILQTRNYVWYEALFSANKKRFHEAFSTIEKLSHLWQHMDYNNRNLFSLISCSGAEGKASFVAVTKESERKFVRKKRGQNFIHMYICSSRKYSRTKRNLPKAPRIIKKLFF